MRALRAQTGRKSTDFERATRGTSLFAGRCIAQWFIVAVQTARQDAECASDKVKKGRAARIIPAAP
jgi:hypothetical protein